MLKIWIMTMENRILIRNYLNFFHVFVNIYTFYILFAQTCLREQNSTAKYGSDKLFLK